jgi:gamma-glutamylputrescine oxidase
VSSARGNYYDATTPARPAVQILQGRVDTAVCIVGAGFAGLATALGLVERGQRDVVLLEAERVAYGASGRNGGFVFGGYSLDNADLLAQLGPVRARAAYALTRDAVHLIRQRIARHAIDCDAVEGGAVLANWFDDESILDRQQSLMADHFGVQWQRLDKAALAAHARTDRYFGGLLEPDAFHFHPLKYALGEAAAITAGGGRIHEQSPVRAIERTAAGFIVRTPRGEVRARELVIAGGGYLSGLVPPLERSMLPIATYVMVTEPLHARMQDALTTQAAVYDTRFAFDYYRPLPDTRLLWGGRISVLDRSAAEVRRLLYRDMLKVFPQLEGVRIDYAWSGLMSYARHQMPQVGRVEDGLWVAQAFGGHGVAPTTFAGEIIASAIAQEDPRWREFSDYGLVSALKPAGFMGAQLGYWWAEFKDAWKDRMEHR